MIKKVQLNYLQSSIGIGFNISLPDFQKTYDDPQLWTCFSFVFHFMGWQLCILIPFKKLNRGVKDGRYFKM